MCGSCGEETVGFGYGYGREFGFGYGLSFGLGHGYDYDSISTRRRTCAPSSHSSELEDAARAGARSASQRIDEEIRDPDVLEECRWVKPSNPLGVPVWPDAGILCTGEASKQVVKLTFAKGAALPDPRGRFDASLQGGARRAIDVREGEQVDARSFKALVKVAIAEDERGGRGKLRRSARAGVASGPNARGNGS